MRFMMITIFAVIGRLVDLAIAKPVLNRKAGGMAIPLARYSSFPDFNKSVNLDTFSSHAISVREKILSRLDNYGMNTGTMHPFTIRRSESEPAKRGASAPLTTYQDDIWVCEISIGTPPKTLKIQIDTGTADMWVLETGCVGISADRDLWDPASSESADYEGLSFRRAYTDETIVKGELYSDNVTIAGLTADPQTFGSVRSYTSHLPDNGDADGLLGLAFASITKFGAYPLLQSLVAQGRLINPTFSFKLSPSGAEMYIGGANSMLYNGDITYTRVTNPGFWQVSMDDIRVNGDTILENVPVIFDTGANHILGDWDRVAELYVHLGGTLEDRGDLGYYYLPCDSFPILGLTFGGRTFEIPSEVFRLNLVEEGLPDCFGAIVAQRSRIKFWNIGTTFLQGVYSVFDYSTEQVGFAKLA